MKFSYRSATIDDLEVILELNLGMFEYEAGFFDGVDVQWPYTEQAVNFFSKGLNNPEKYLCIIVEADGQVVAYILGWMNEFSWLKKPSVFELQHIYVKPEYRGKGVGQELFRQMEVWVKEHGGQQLMINEVLQVNEKAIKFYEKMGYNVMYKTFNKVLK